ncbi:CREB3L2 family protein [Megaselia abdita]
MDIMDNFYDGDFKDIWDSDLDPSDTLKLSTDADMPEWFLERDVKSTVILNDKLISDALLGNLPIKTEHSYSLSTNSTTDNMPDLPTTKMDDMEDECYPAISMRTATSNTRRSLIDTKQTSNKGNNRYTSMCTPLSINVRSNSMSPRCKRSKLRNSVSSSSDDIDIEDIYVKDEPLSPESSCPSSPEQKSDSKMIITIDENIKNADVKKSLHSSYLMTTNIKMEQSSGNTFGLPPTPPASLPSDESEGNQSPEHHLLVSPLSSPNIRQQTQQLGSLSSNSSTISIPASSSSSNSSTADTTSSAQISNRRNTASTSSNTSQSSSSSNSPCNRGYTGSSTRQPIHTPLISSQPGSTGTLTLTEEEKRTLLAEGYPIPTRLPLTKAEEKSLKKIRRKIKNKISAQESRRKKKEYMDQLERRVEVLVSENVDYKKKIDSLEDSNANLLSQLQKLQAMINKQRKN